MSNYHDPKLDGLIYSSTQTDGSGKNIVIFNGNVNKVDKNTTSGFFEEQNYGQPDFGYFISEVESDNENITEIHDLDREDVSLEEANLLFVEKSLKLHKIKKVKHIFDSTEVIVRMKKDESMFPF